MTEATIYRAKDSGKIMGFQVKDHSGYAPAGTDIVCAAISMLVLNTINSIEKFSNDIFDAYEDTDNAVVGFDLKGDPGEKTSVLLDSMYLGLATVQKKYGNEFLKLIDKEV